MARTGESGTQGRLTHRGRRGRRRRIDVLVAFACVAVVLFVLTPFAISWGAAGLLLTPHHDITTKAGSVVKVTADHIVLQRRASTERPGTYGLVYDGGRAIIGPVTATTKNTITRQLTSSTGTLTAGTQVQLDPDVWGGSPQSSLDIPYQIVDVDGNLGPMPAWYVPGHGSTWLIFVHGIDGKRQGGLRPMTTITDAGIPAMYITYRNDVGAPKSKDGLFHLGDTEWRDLNAAVKWASGHGASKFILFGDSMGGSIVTQFIHRSHYASDVVGMVLDSPVLDWTGVIEGQAHRLKLGLLSPLVLDYVQGRGHLSLTRLNELDQTDAFTMPILLFQGLDDKLVPHAESQRFADTTGATYVPVPGAGHIQSWNVEPQNYDAKLAAFLQKVLASPRTND